MTKELFVSSTPHETKVGLVEDDQLAEIYLERENEYTLAGSIYKGRVTRVLPGMQSAFVDIGLERDAFLYVSDFMELEDPDEVEEVSSGNGRQAQPYQPQQRNEAMPISTDTVEPGSAAEAQPLAEGTQAPAEGREPEEPREGGRGWRGRRRRRGGKRGERMPESRFAHSGQEAPREVQGTEADRPDRTERPERAERPDHNDRTERPRFERTERSDRPQRSDFGPPPGYQPMVLPGESISKYRRAAQSQPAVGLAAPTETSPGPEAPLAEGFPDDEPMFDAAVAAAQPGPRAQAEVQAALTEAPFRWERAPERTQAAPVFADEAPQNVSDETAEISLSSPAAAAPAPAFANPTGAMEEEEIEEEEEEADLAHFVEELAEDDAFEEMEEETHAAGESHHEDHHDDHDHDHDIHHDDVTDEVPVAGALTGETIATSSGEGLHNLEGVPPLPVEEAAEEEDEEDAALEEAQAEAEALMEAESRVEGTVDASAEVRAPSPTAPFTQRQPRPGRRDRERRGGGGGQRGRRGGRRFPRREPQNVPLISDLLKEGQEVLVQIAKEPIGKKGARITSHIALPGRFLVYMPTVNHTGVSRKIASEEERQRLKRIILSERENGHGGFIVRTAAQNASEEELRADIRFLKGLWTEIRNRADAGKSPALIYHDLNVVERVLRDQVTSDFSVIWVDSEQEYERILRFANRFQPALVKRVKLYSKETPLYDQFGLNEELNKALKSKVWLKSGGYIVINQTEALVAIDINTGKYVGKTARLEDTIVKTNVDAIKEIVRQIRLRDLGGIIVIDFIDMDERRNRQKVMQALEEALRSDRAPSKALQFNDFGLVAITRKRVKQSLERTIGSPCPYCQSTGYVKSVTTVCNEIYVEMRKLAKHLDHSDVMLRVNPEVAKALKIAGGRWLNELEELTKKTVIVKSDPALHQEQFDIN